MSMYAYGSGQMTAKCDIPADVLKAFKTAFPETYVEDVVRAYFDGDYDEQDTHNALLAIAPYIVSGDFQFNGDYNNYWRFIFRDGKWIEQQGEIVYTDGWEV